MIENEINDILIYNDPETINGRRIRSVVRALKRHYSDIIQEYETQTISAQEAINDMKLIRRELQDLINDYPPSFAPAA